jgi:hypothetical protein
MPTKRKLRVVSGQRGLCSKRITSGLDDRFEKLEGAIYVIPMRLDDCSLPRQFEGGQSLNYFPTSQQATAFEK